MRYPYRTGCDTVAVMSYTLADAAQATGNALISGDIRSARIFATRNDRGSVTIDPVALHRVRPLISRSNGLGNIVATVQSNTQPGRTAAAAGFEKREIGLLRVVIAEEVSRIAELQADKEDLPCLDQARALLTDRRTKAASRTSVWSRFPAWWRPR